MNKVDKGKPIPVLILSVFFAGVVVCLTAGSALSQDCVPVQYTDEHEPERRALVIGNAIYGQHAPVTSAATDALEMTKRLTELNFKVGPPLVANTKAEFSKALDDFRATIGEGDLVVFYYSGHGFSYGTDSFLAPIDLPRSITENELPDAAMAIDSVKYRLESRKPGMVIMILDVSL
jgi:uncharacterized caspase-like protein